MTGKGPVSPDGTGNRGAVSLQRRKSALSPGLLNAALTSKDRFTEPILQMKVNRAAERAMGLCRRTHKRK